MNCPKCNLETESFLEMLMISEQGYCWSCEKITLQNKENMEVKHD